MFRLLQFLWVFVFVGRQYDGNGNAEPWWSESTIDAFTKQVRKSLYYFLPHMGAYNRTSRPALRRLHRGVAGVDEGDVFNTGSLFYTDTLFCRDTGIEEGSGRCRRRNIIFCLLDRRRLYQRF